MKSEPENQSKKRKQWIWGVRNGMCVCIYDYYYSLNIDMHAIQANFVHIDECPVNIIHHCSSLIYSQINLLPTGSSEFSKVNAWTQLSTFVLPGYSRGAQR